MVIKKRTPGVPCPCGAERENPKHGYCRKCMNEYMRKRTAAGKNGYRSLTPEATKRQRARAYLGTYVKRGKVIKPDVCSRCESTDRIHGHHEDYDKPLEVVWVCHSCHMDIHGKRAIVQSTEGVPV